ncbi:general substrate transporter [Penicillium verhagenii]|nr:general substrate transporter [Penicillium verhagenii]
METGKPKGKVYTARIWWPILGMSTGSLSFGYASAIIASTLDYMKIADAPATTGAMNSLFYVGGFFGALFNSWYVDRVGRKASIGTACMIMLISCALCAGSVHAAMFIVFRLTTGWR